MIKSPQLRGLFNVCEKINFYFASNIFESGIESFADK